MFREIVKNLTKVLILSTLTTACVSLKNSNTTYNKLIADDCYGNATLGQTYVCVEGRWLKSAELEAKKATANSSLSVSTLSSAH